MTRQTLSLKKKPLASTTDTRQFQLPLDTDAAHEPIKVDAGNKNSKVKNPPQLLLQAIEDAVTQRTPIFIQMRCGTGYKGLPVQIHQGCVQLVEATIHGTKRVANTSVILIHLSDCGRVAHIHQTHEPSDSLAYVEVCDER